MSDTVEAGLLQVQLDELESAHHMYKSKVVQIMEMLRVTLEEDDDPEEALKILKSALGYENNFEEND